MRCCCANDCRTKLSEEDLRTLSVPHIDLHYSGIKCSSFLPPWLSCTTLPLPLHQATRGVAQQEQNKKNHTADSYDSCILVPPSRP